MYISILSYVKSTRKQQKKRSEMANTKQKIDRWSSSENTMSHVIQSRKSRTPITELSAALSMSNNNNSPHNDE
jgi:hypothetical protein